MPRDRMRQLALPCRRWLCGVRLACHRTSYWEWWSLWQIHGLVWRMWSNRDWDCTWEVDAMFLLRSIRDLHSLSSIRLHLLLQSSYQLWSLNWAQWVLFQSACSSGCLLEWTQSLGIRWILWKLHNGEQSSLESLFCWHLLHFESSLMCNYGAHSR